MNESDTHPEGNAPQSGETPSPTLRQRMAKGWATPGQVLPPHKPDQESEAFYQRAIWRMQHAMIAAGVVVVALAAWHWGSAGALGAALGGALSWHNFRWLTKAVNALGERITTGHSRERGGLIVFRFTARILLMAVGAYAIFKYSRGGLYGYVAGLCVPVPALFYEAACELIAAYRREL